MTSGIYHIGNLVNHKCYVGQSANVKERWASHRAALRHNRHHNKHLQDAWNKYGEHAFVFSVAEAIVIPDGLTRKAKKDFLKPHEQWWMDYLSPEYNQAPSAGSPLGTKHTAETRAKMSKAHKGFKFSPESLVRMSEAQKGHPTSDETRAKISATLTGRKLSPEHAAKSVGRQFDAEARRKISEAGKGRVQSAETKAKRSATLMGHPMSQETRDKISAKQKAHYARKRLESPEGLDANSHLGQTT